MRLPHLRIFRGRNRSPAQEGVGGALEEAFDVLATDERMEADLHRLIGELSEVEGSLHAKTTEKPKRKR